MLRSFFEKKKRRRYDQKNMAESDEEGTHENLHLEWNMP
jgi:hypothetical protein